MSHELQFPIRTGLECFNRYTRITVFCLFVSLCSFPTHHRDPMCQEVADMMLDGSCLFLGDKLYECHRMTDFPRSWLPGYGGCIRENNMDPFEVCTYHNIRTDVYPAYCLSLALLNTSKPKQSGSKPTTKSSTGERQYVQVHARHSRRETA